MARRKRREREPVETVDYRDPEGNVLTLRQSLSDKTIRKINKPHPKDAASAEDVWARRNEMLFEHLAVNWESPAFRSTTRRCSSAATGWRIRRSSAGFARRSQPTSSATSQS